MSKYLTIKAFLKDLIAIRDQPHTFLKGYEKLTEEETYLLGVVSAEIANSLNADEFQVLLTKFKLNKP